LKIGSSDFLTGESEPMTHIRPIFCVALLCCAVLFALPAAAAGIIYGPRNRVDPSDPEPYFSAHLLPKQTGCDINKQGYRVCIETGLFFSRPQL